MTATSTRHSRRPEGTCVDLMIEHYTAGAGSAVSTAAYMERVGNSAHAIDDRAGIVVEPVPLERAAWHAGDHDGPMRHGSRFPSPEQLDELVAGERELVALAEVPYRPGNVNGRSVGIEHVNLGWAYGDDKLDAVRLRHRNPASRDRSWQPYTDEQIASSIRWHASALARVPTLRFVCGHEDVVHRDTMGRPGAKLDPGPAFPWAVLLEPFAGRLVRVLYDFGARGWRLAA